MGEKDYRVRTWVAEEALARNIGNHLSFDEEDYRDIAEAMLNPEDLPGLRQKYV